MKKYFAFCLLICAAMISVASKVYAGDYADLDFIGFSADSKYLAFEEYGEEDLGGFYSTIYIIDTTRNIFAAPPTAVRDNEDQMTSARSIRGRARARATKNLKKFKVVRGNVGNLLAAHLLTDWTYSNSIVKRDGAPEKLRLNYYINPNSPNTYEYYELSLISHPYPDNEKSPCGPNTLTFELSLDHFMNGEKDRDSILLQKDKDLPARRNCPYGYRIEQVFEYKNRIVVFLNAFSQGFEGPDMRYLAVTGKWISTED